MKLVFNKVSRRASLHTNNNWGTFVKNNTSEVDENSKSGVEVWRLKSAASENPSGIYLLVWLNILETSAIVKPIPTSPNTHLQKILFNGFNIEILHFINSKPIAD